MWFRASLWQRWTIGAALALCWTLVVSIPGAHAGNGNPLPGVPHDTIMIHIQPMTGNPNDCNGGHALHIGAYMEQGRVVSIPSTSILITMVDWVQVDNDGDGVYDEDPIDGVDNDGLGGHLKSGHRWTAQNRP